MIKMGKCLDFCVNFAGGSQEATTHINKFNSKRETYSIWLASL